MLEDFYGWVKTIAAFLIFMSLVLKLFPEGKNVKYIRYFMGMVLVLVVLGPLGKLLRLEEAFSMLESELERNNARTEFTRELVLMGETYAEEVIGSYEEDLSVQALKYLEEAGYEGCSVKVTIDADQESEGFGLVERIEVLPLKKGDTDRETGKIVIEKKKVQILSEEPSENSYLEKAEDSELRKMLSEKFSISEAAVLVVR
ncbi:MAG: stage III sporulation protein AF [Lachnospiraceae bacterium]|jgi:stage III sporulation protein AF|nr:stage III sporulation protein AF [Lachnospiraceae bacterium]